MRVSWNAYLVRLRGNAQPYIRAYKTCLRRRNWRAGVLCLADTGRPHWLHVRAYTVASKSVHKIHLNETTAFSALLWFFVWCRCFVVDPKQVPEDPAELHKVMFQKKLTTSKDAGTFKRPKRKVDDGSAKRERRRLKRQMKRQRTARCVWYATVRQDTVLVCFRKFSL